ncbi:MAG: DUF4436 family protein [Candidatus Microthrix sp.]|nr:DUF4436 family protein [Candidatus Microthrix sp.]MBK7020441.1 DUF4436 family protein [Candidatus Microthrix sp.]
MANTPTTGDGTDPPGDATRPVRRGVSSARWTRRGRDGALAGRNRIRRQVEPITNLGLRRWPDKQTRPIRNLLILVVLLGPLLGLAIAVTSIPAGPTDQVLSSGPTEDGGVKIGRNEVGASVTLLNPDLARGELTARVVIQPGSDLIAGDLTLTRTIRVNVLSDVAGRIQTVFDAGSRVEPVTATLQLSGSRLTRYPVDNYLVNFKLLVQREIDPGEGQAIPDQPEFENVPIVATVQSSLSDLRASGTTHPGNESNVLNADFDLQRPRSVVVFAVALMGLAWLLALGCVALAWGVLVQAREIPVWSWGFYAGVLFALPQLRNGLPGSPPFGSIIDWAAYYWALGLVGVSLLALILAGNVAIRSVRTDSDAELEPDSDPDPDRGDSGPQSPA